MALRSRTLRRMRTMVSLALLGASLAACGLLAGLTEDYKVNPDGGPGSTNEGGGGDAPFDPDGPGPDGSKDGSPPGDGGTEGSADGGFCQINGGAADVVYCWDFELGSPSGPKWGWDDYDTSGATGTLAVVPKIGVGGSKGLRATLANPPGTGGNVYLRKQIAGNFNSFRKHEMSFSFAETKKSTLYTNAVGAIGWGLPIKYIGVSIYKAAPDDGIDVGDPPGVLGGVNETAKLNEWHRARITLERATDAGPYTTTIYVSAAAGGETMVDQRAGFDGGALPTEVLVGAFFSSPEPTGTIDVVIDDVLVKRTP